MISINKYLKGDELYGDDFNDQLLKTWFAAETNAYSDIYKDVLENYQFHAVDKLYGFRFVSKNDLNVLGIGSGNGVEFLPIWDKISQLTIIENSDNYQKILINKIIIKYLQANYDGRIDSEGDIFDLVVCFSSLHHIANVSDVMSEISRVIKRGGLALIREPIVSMGDWRFKRKGLTKNERGIPLKIFRDIIQKCKLTIISENIRNFRLLVNLFSFYKDSIYNHSSLTRIDRFLSRLFSWNITYYPFCFFQRIAPISVFYVLRKKIFTLLSLQQIIVIPHFMSS